MDNSEKLIEKLQEDQEYIKNIQINLFENFNLLLENQKNKVENQDLVIQNQSLIIRNQDVIVNNQINIIKNQKQIVENQVTLSVILKTQAKVLHLIENLAGNPKTEEDINAYIMDVFTKSKEQFDKGALQLNNIRNK